MEILQINNEREGYFMADDNGKEAGRMTYTWAGPDKLIIDHTEVNPEYNGKGIGKQLVMKAVAYARENEKKIVPLCPFARSVFEKVEEIRDVLFKLP